MVLPWIAGAVMLQASESATQSIENYDQQIQLKEETLELPYLSAQMAPPLKFEVVESLFELPSEMRFQGDVEFKKEDHGFHVLFNKPEEASSISWKFEKTLDVRNRWFRIRYSGLEHDQKMGLQIEKAELGQEGSVFSLSMISSPKPEEVFFKMPDQAEFLDVNILRLIFDLDQAQGQHLDFMILGLDLLPRDADPLAAGEERRN